MSDFIADRANEIRVKHRQTTPPVDVEKICNDLDIQVFRTDLAELEEKSGRPISGLIYVNKTTLDKQIYVNSVDNGMRQNFTIAHELGHYFIHIPADDNGVIISFRGLQNARENEADLFAVELLMPEEMVREEHKKLPFPTASYLAEVFRVPKAAMQIRLNDLGLGYIG